ncbi:sn-glycerol-3-phosphate transport system permease protein ugpA [uncultured Clostridium sp.]|nr:sn-glycerol-3-phosphate transport system permease protein ugpA [uncultured Clostridium sp.]
MKTGLFLPGPAACGRPAAEEQPCTALGGLGLKKRKWITKRNGFICVFLLPGILLFIVIYAYPLVNIFFTSFCKWNYKNFISPEFLGFGQMFDNYIKLFTVDANFQRALVNTIKWVALTLVIQVPFTLLAALVLSKKPKGWKLTRNVFVIPNIISTAAIGLIFLNIYSPSRGIITELCNKIWPGSNISVLANEKFAFWGVTFSFILFGGSLCLLLLTQIFSIDPGIYEAARVDGASSVQIDLRITLPLLRPMIGTIAVMAANYGLLLYNEVALITGGGPDNATYSLSYYIYKTALGSTKLNFARGNTAGVIQFILGILMVGAINKLFRTNKAD